jgi:DNA-binding NarL/FixJ family response regulator
MLNFQISREKLVSGSKGMSELRILLADDQERVRYGLRALLRQQPGWTVIGEAATTNQLFALISVLEPDMVLLDWNLGGLEGESLLPSLHKLRKNLPVIVLSGQIEVENSALEAGASAFISKVNSPDQLVETIRNVVKKTKN